MKINIKSIIILCLFIISIFFSSCESSKYKKYTIIYTEYFDTVTTLTGYARSEKEFLLYANAVEAKLSELHKIFDIYNNYEGINNLKTINDNAGKYPIEVCEEILTLLELSFSAYESSSGAFDVALGNVLKIWHSYREEAMENDQNAKLPSVEELRAASIHCNINNIQINKNNGTVYLQEAGISIDAGAVAKGFAAQIAADSAREMGAESMLINMGGNVVAIGKPLDGKREAWGIGIRNPSPASGENDAIDIVRVCDKAVVTSGNYQRFYTVNGINYHHIIDPGTLMPASHYSSVTVICGDSAIADILSTSLFILSEDKGRELALSYDADALWIYPDGKMSATDGYKSVSDYYSDVQ